MSEAHIKLTAKLYDARATVRTMWGDKYAEGIKAPMKGLQKVATAHGVDIIQAALLASKDLAEQHRGPEALIILAAAVEILEPSA